MTKEKYNRLVFTFCNIWGMMYDVCILWTNYKFKDGDFLFYLNYKINSIWLISKVDDQKCTSCIGLQVLCRSYKEELFCFFFYHRQEYVWAILIIEKHNSFKQLVHSWQCKLHKGKLRNWVISLPVRSGERIWRRTHCVCLICLCILYPLLPVSINFCDTTSKELITDPTHETDEKKTQRSVHYRAACWDIHAVLATVLYFFELWTYKVKADWGGRTFWFQVCQYTF